MSYALAMTIRSIFLTALSVVALLGPSASAAPTLPPEVQVYKTPTCDCCSKWVEHLEGAGFRVRVQDRTDLTPIKRQAKVPPALAACHTAFVDGYVIEGHVPADTVKRLLAERPKIAGLVVPGMPQGSPGMETGRVEPYDVLSLQLDGTTVVFERHP